MKVHIDGIIIRSIVLVIWAQLAFYVFAVEPLNVTYRLVFVLENGPIHSDSSDTKRPDRFASMSS